ncbi:oligosaccharide flippase family protein [Flavihumibacter sp. RY-1]|uniref:Oligosaccharide flippase family protein n=1 Tax=Flavihumibacter fluminis TaxID=2909236 RepID=A0ABS9BL23_9BACT|nr:oligosaccharide flippase family protein [Flavihumibacter fluminis]MCF1716391.1 oligosaccharide flippase family protein [Flavihumibacter fluminis]
MDNNRTVQALWVGLGSLSTFALSFVSAAILSRYFNKHDYGTYKQILFVYNSLLIFFSAGLPRVYSYFLPKYSVEEGKSIVNKIGVALAISGLLFGVVLFSCAEVIGYALRNPDISIGLKYFSLVPVFMFPTFGVEGIFATYQKTKYIAVYQTLTRFLMLFFIVGAVVFFEGTYLNAIYGWVIVSILSLIIALYFKSIPFKGVKSVSTNLTYKDLYTYSLPIVLASIAGVAIKSADQFYISRFFGSEIFAEFSNGFIELPLVTMITGATSAVLMPLFSRIKSKQVDYNEICVVWKSALYKSATIIYPLVIFFMWFAQDIVVLLYSNVYSNSSLYFQLALVINFFNLIIFAPLLFAFGETQYYFKLHLIIALLAWIGGAIVLFIFNSPIAISIFSVCLSIFKIVLGMIKSSELLDTKVWNLFPFRTLIPILIQSICVILLVSFTRQIYFGDLHIVIRLLVCFILYSGLVLITSRFFGIDYLTVISPIIKRLI